MKENSAEWLDKTDKELDELMESFSDKGDIISFCEKEGIPYKSYFSKKRLKEDTLRHLKSTNLFRRISKSKGE